MREWASGHDQEHHCYQTGCGHLLPLSIFTVTITNIRELADSLCRDGNAQYSFECLYDQQDSYKWPKTTRKTVKGKSMCMVAKVPFFSFFLITTTMFNNDISKMVWSSAHRHFSRKLMVITAQSSTTTHCLHGFKFTTLRLAAVRCLASNFVRMHTQSFVPWPKCISSVSKNKLRKWDILICVNTCVVYCANATLQINLTVCTRPR